MKNKQVKTYDITHLGSNWNNSTNARDFNWNLNNSSANSNRNIGTHVFYANSIINICFYLASWQKISDRIICVSKKLLKAHSSCIKQLKVML